MQPKDRDDPSALEMIERELVRLIRSTRRTPELRWGDRDLRLPLTSYVLLNRLYDDGPQRSGDLARGAGLDKSTMSRHVAALERDGLVHRVEDPDDGRAALITLSEAGRRGLTEVRATRRTALRGRLAGWTERDRVEFARLLARLNDDLMALRPADPPGDREQERTHDRRPSHAGQA